MRRLSPHGISIIQLELEVKFELSVLISNSSMLANVSREGSYLSGTGLIMQIFFENKYQTGLMLIRAAMMSLHVAQEEEWISRHLTLSITWAGRWY